MYRSRWGTYGRRDIDSPYAGGGAAVASIPSGFTPAGNAGGVIVSGGGSLVDLKNEARSIIAAIRSKGANPRVSQSAVFASVAKTGNRATDSANMWRAYVAALRARLSSL